MNSVAAVRNNSLKLFSAIWATVIIVPLIYFPAPAVLVGHPWKVELAISLFLGLFLAGYAFARAGNDYLFGLAPKLILLIIAPCCALIVLSAASVFWAGSALSVLHHTLVWAVYLIFLLLALRIAGDKRLFRISVIALGSVIGTVSLLCIIDYVFSEQINATFGFRYGRYAEIYAALLPLFFSFVLRLRRKYLVWAIFVTLLLWCSLLFSMSRGALVSSVVGLSVFIILRILTKKKSAEKRRLIFASLGLLFFALLIQLPYFSTADQQKPTTFTRFKLSEEKDASNSLARNVRFFFAGVGLEMISNNLLTGIGADNFGLQFNKYRAVFSAESENQAAAELQQDFLPERAHNEYLQILAELGLFGAIIFLCFLTGIFKLGLAELIKNRFDPANILTHSAAAGVVAFLISSMFSSFSFRLIQNGLVFFFLVAILLRNYVTKRDQVAKENFFTVPLLKPIFTAVSLTVCLLLNVFSASKAISQFYVYTAEKERDFKTAKHQYETAMMLDPANASANYLFGLRLLTENQYEQSAVQLRLSIEKGINTSVSYSYLISAQTLMNQSKQAVETGAESVEIFPYSVFLRVRHASLLKKQQLADESRNHLNFAVRLNKKQAETWWILINNGALETMREAGFNKEILSLTELDPEPAIYAVLTEREIIYPNEKTTFNF